MEIIGDDIYIYTTFEHRHYSLIVVQNSMGEVLELQIEQYYE